ncbi:hypothetical protein ACFQPA_02345 [Halomarina halobia]|uniref:Uncharacterized protein n=1 Tax=Halomarina halobia TaxID=3033386 RepID=A0ABD6A5H6_9EURY|nr:hypothetical protein [Halomarina sp. PSR21]
MSLDELDDAVERTYRDLGDGLAVDLDRETRHELAFLTAALDPEDPDEIVRRAVHMFFQTAVDTGRADFHLRSGFDVTYDEYLSGMTYEEMTGAPNPPDNDGRRYQF